LEEYLSMTDAFLTRKRCEFEVTYRDVLNDHAFHDAMDDDISQLWTGFPTTLLNTTFVAACACIEGSAAILCKRFDSESALQKTLAWQDTKDQGVKRSAAFLKENFQLHLADHSMWSSLSDFGEIRNCIVHAASDMNQMKKPQQLRQAVHRQAVHGVSIDQHGHLAVTATLVKHTLKGMLNFWEALHVALRDNAVVGPHYWP